MSEEEFEEDAEPELEEEDLPEEDLEDDALDGDLDDDLVLDDDLADDALVVEDVAAVIEPDADAKPATVVTPGGTGEEDEDVVDLDEELHPDDVEAPLDALLQEKTAAATLEDDEEELEDEEPDGDERGDGPARIVPRRADEFVCRSCFLVLPRHQLADEERMLCRDCA